MVESLQCILKKIEDKLKSVSFPEDTKFECVKVTNSHFVDISMKVAKKHLQDILRRCFQDV